MPMMQSVVERLNTRFNRDNIGNVDATLLAPGTTVASAATRSTAGAGAIKATPTEAEYITTTFSATDLDKLREVLHWAVTQPTRVPVQFLWVPADKAKIEYWHVAEQGGSMAGVSVLLHGPTPAPVISNSHP